MEYFTDQNTTGYTPEELEKMNQKIEELMIEDGWDNDFDCFDIKIAKERILAEVSEEKNKAEKYVVKKARNIDFSSLMYLIVTEDDNLLSHNCNPESGEPFSGSWTDDIQEYESDETIQLYCEKQNIG